MTPEPDDLPPGLAAALDQIFADSTSPGAPDADRLLALFGGPAAITRDEAEITFSTDGDPALIGVRAAGLLDQQQVVAESGDVTVVVDIVAEPDDRTATLIRLRGEVIGGDEVFSVQLLAGAEEIALTVTDAFGEFGFDAVPRGTYELVVAGARREISVTLALE